MGWLFIKPNNCIFSALHFEVRSFSVFMSDCDGTGNIVRSIDKYAQKEYNYEYEGGKVTHSTVYNGEERITKVIDSFDGITEYEYDALGQLKTETVNGTVVNHMTYDNYGNITEKNGVVYQYGKEEKLQKFRAQNAKQEKHRNNY